MNNRTAGASYIQPGAPPPPPPAIQPNTYIMPTAALQQAMPPPEPAPEPQARDQDPHHDNLISEWRARHGSDWVRADDLAPAVRRVIDERERLPAIRQKLRQLVATHSELEAKVVGNRATPVVLYRVIEMAGLKG